MLHRYPAYLDLMLRGTWPKEEYYALFDIQCVLLCVLFTSLIASRSRIVGALVLLINAFARLDPKWCSRLVHNVSLSIHYYLHF